jgi:hypothetical protein
MPDVYHLSMNRINRKTIIHATGEAGGHPRPYLKRVGNKKLRRQPICDSANPLFRARAKNRAHKRDFTCPICLGNLKHQYEFSEFKHYGQCLACGALKSGRYRCPHCRSRNIWIAKRDTRCKRCGKYKGSHEHWAFCLDVK